MTIDAIYNTVKYLMRKNQQGALRPSQFNSLWAMAERQAFDDYLPVLEKNQRIASALMPFVKQNVPLVQLPNGSALLPTGYYYIDAVTPQTYPNSIVKIKYIEHDEINAILGSSLIAPDQNHIFYTEYPGQIQIWPNPAPPLAVTYLAAPIYGHWAYTADATGLPVYDPVNSVDPQWYDMEINHIINILLSELGLAMKDSTTSQYAELKIKEGK